ncbi:MAG: Clp protease [Catenulispora sp.]|nr:Clp protease [Catenulispora sp.]
MFERFTPGARAVVIVAQDAARSLGHRHIGTEHLLLGLLRDTDGVAGRALAGAGADYAGVVAGIERIEQKPAADLAEKDKAALRTIGIDLDRVRAAVEEAFGPGVLDSGPHGETCRSPWWRRRQRQAQRRQGAPRGHIPFTPRAKKVLGLSLREALKFKHDYIGTEHVLLGMLREGQGLAGRILTEDGVNLAQVRDLVLAELQRAA